MCVRCLPPGGGWGGYCMVAHAASPLPGSYYWLLMMWGYDVIKILGSIGTILEKVYTKRDRGEERLKIHW